ncbi:MAG: M14 family metallopeptidase [Pseudomonadota bacterium]
MKLDRLDHLPEAIAAVTPDQIRRVFPNPALISIAGDKPEPVFVSTLLHGNETTSFTVLQHLQRTYGSHPPPRSLMIFVGNVAAAQQGARFLESQPDFNRIWAHGSGPYHDLAREVVSIARGADVFASIDIHNNTGANPLYGCVNALRPADLQLAAMFAPIGVFYLNPSTTQSVAFAQLCPAVTVECGQSGDPDGVAAAIRLVDAVLRLDAFAGHPPEPGALDLYQTVGRVVVDPDCSFAFGRPDVDLSLRPDLEAMNFKTMQAGTTWGETHCTSLPLRVLDEHGGDLTPEFFGFDRGVIYLGAGIVPAMITSDLQVIRQDCLCYLMTPA